MANKTKNYKRRKFPVKGRDEEKGTPTEHKYNDVSWYVKNEAMLRDAASLSFNNPLGYRLDPKRLWNNSDNTLNINKAYWTVPGVLGIEFVPTIGLSTESTSPANLAAQNIYSYVRYLNSGAKNYDQADLMLYLLAMDSLYMYWNWCKRIYGYTMLYMQKNRYYPKGLAKLDGVNLDDIAANISDFRLWLNSFAAQISSFCVPAVMPFFIRHSWMCSNLYLDSEDAKAQTYMFVPAGFYQYNETGSQYGGKLDFRVGPTAKNENWNFAALRLRGKQMMDAIAYSEDIGVMSGDILKAYGQDKLFKLAPVEPDYQIIPVYNEEVLTQIENSAIVSVQYDIDSTSYVWNGMTVSQDPDTGYLVWSPELLPIAYQKQGTILNMHKDEVSPADVMVATRLTACQQGDKLVAVGTEFITRWRIVRLNSSGSPSTVEVDQIINLGALDTSLGAEVSSNMLPVVCALTQFNRHPIVPIFGTIANTPHYFGSIGDIANYTVVDSDTLEQIHGTAIMSEFNIPQIGSF